MLKYLKESFRRKKARRFTKEYPASIETYAFKDGEKVEFAQWDNPLFSTVEFNRDVINFFNNFIKKGGFVIDIGAGIGDTTVPMALAAGTEGLTLGFDPNPYVFKILEKNASLNKEKTNIETHCLAISPEEKDFYFISSEASFANGGISSSKKSQHGKFVYPEKIKGVNLMQFLEKNYIQWLDKLAFIKIDTEGYDKEIIKSISDLILKYKPTLIAESFKKAPDVDKIELYEVIANLGYEMYSFEDFNVKSEMVKLTDKRDLIRWKTTVNVYAIPLD
jgi:FkbM family methyltransferase